MTPGVCDLSLENMQGYSCRRGCTNCPNAMAMKFVRKFLEEHPTGSGDIAVIANAGGLDLLRSGVTPYEQEITELARAHVNVHFVACAQSIRNLRSQGIEPKFLPSVDASLPAFDQIIRRVEDGWRYMSVESLMKTS